MTTFNITFDDPSLFTYDSDKIDVSGGKASLKLIDLVSQDFNQPFTSDSGFTYDSDKTEFSAGQVQQKDKAPTDSTCWATYTTDIDLNVSPNGGILTGSATGGAAVSGGKLDLAHGDTRYVDYDADVNADSQQTGTIKFKVTPSYSGSPASDMYFFANTKQASSRINELSLYHRNTGTISLRIYDSSGILAGESTFVNWSPTSGVEYEFEVTYDLTVGANRFFIDGIQQGITSTITTTRDANIGLMRVGSNFNASVVSNFEINDLIIFSTVQHTANYTPGYTLTETRYLEDLITFPVFTYPGVGAIQLYTAYATTQTSNAKFNNNGEYWTGSAWAASDDSYTQMNTAADINTNIGTLTAADTVTIKMIMEASNTQSKVDILTVTYTGQQYPDDSPTIYKTAGDQKDVLNWIGFVVTLGGGNEGSVFYQISLDGSTWQYWDGSAWTTASLATHYNTASDINTNISSFTDNQLLTFYVRSFLVGDGTQAVELDNIAISYVRTFDCPIIAAIQDTCFQIKKGNSCSVNVLIQDANETTITDLSLADSIKFMLKKLPTDSDANAVVTKTLDDGILIDNPSTGYIRIILESTDSDIDVRDYYVGLQIIWDDNVKEVCFKFDDYFVNFYSVTQDVIR